MTYTESTPSYNDRRYGKPWMARLHNSIAKDFTFLDWDGRPGSVGEFRFEAEPGTLLAYGQKDLRKGRGGIDGYQICMPDGSMPGISDSQALALIKLPASERPAKCAEMKIAANEQIIAESTGKEADPFHSKRIADAQAALTRYRSFVPAPPEVNDADYYLNGGC